MMDIIICYYQNPKNLYLFKRINSLNNLMSNNLGKLELDDMRIPYFFFR